MIEMTGPERFADRHSPSGLTRREAVGRVAALLGGAALVGGDRLAAHAVDPALLAQAAAQGAGVFSAADVALLDEIAETILPETTTPGAKAAKTGAFMALMVTDVYTETARQVFRDGLARMDEACRAAHGVGFVQATPAQRLALVEALDLEQRMVMEERAPGGRSRAPAPPAAGDEPPHYFRMMKELALFGYFTSEIGCTRAQRYAETPGRFDPCAPHAPGDRSWSAHA